MTYTREQLEKISNDEINYAVADWLYVDPRYIINMGFDYKDWAVIMPLAVEYGVSLICRGYAWAAIDQDGNIEFNSESPQRAIACCLLMMELT